MHVKKEHRSSKVPEFGQELARALRAIAHLLFAGMNARAQIVLAPAPTRAAR